MGIKSEMELSLVPELIAMGLDHSDIDRLKAERSTEQLNPDFPDELRGLPQYVIGARAITRKMAKGAEI